MFSILWIVVFCCFWKSKLKNDDDKHNLFIFCVRFHDDDTHVLTIYWLRQSMLVELLLLPHV